MTKKFIAKILNLGTVDTRNYRYRVSIRQTADEQYQVIMRLPISELGTTAAIDGWELVAEIR